MSRDLILHIGHFKTGTTAIQVFCAQNRDLLANQGLHYATRPVKFDKHSFLALALLREAGVTELMHGFNHPEDARTLWSRVFDDARALPEGAALLVSSEEFMRLGAHPAALEGLRTLLHEAPDLRVRVIAYLRAPQAHVRSWYNQLVKLGRPVGAYDETVCGQIERIHWDYAQAIMPWVDLLGAEAVILRAFHDDLREDDALYADFLTGLGYRLPMTAQLPAEDPNPRLDDRLLDIKRVLNAAPLPQGQVSQILTRAARQLSAPVSDFDTLRTTARAGIVALADLPHSTLNTAELLAALPEPEDPAQRALSDMVAVLVREIAQSRAAERRLTARLAALEAHLGLDQSDEGGDA